MLQNIPREKVLEVLKQGPNVPARVAKVVGGDSMIVGAILSTCVEAGLVKFSKLKVGGSPLYYLPEDEPKLENFTDKLNEKDRKTLIFLKEQKVLKDSEQNPLTKVSLKAIPDYAKQFQLENELFYRYFLTTEDEAEELARKLLPEKVPIAPIEKKEDKVEKILEKVQEKMQEVKEIDKKIDEELKSQRDFGTSQSEVGTEVRTKQSEVRKEEKKPKSKQPKTEKTPKIDEVFEKLKEYFKNKNLDIIGKDKIKKTEYDLILKNHDTNDYIYCKYKDKKSINEGDLAAALLSSQTKNMKCIFLTTGTLNKKAESMKDKEFKDIMIQKI